MVQMSHCRRTASLTSSFCDPRALVPAYRSTSPLSWSLKPRSVSRARTILMGSAAFPPLRATSTVGTSHLFFRTHFVSMTFRAWLRGMRLAHFKCAHVFSSFNMAASTSGQRSRTSAGVRRSSSRCVTTRLVPVLVVLKLSCCSGLRYGSLTNQLVMHKGMMSSTSSSYSSASRALGAG